MLKAVIIAGIALLGTAQPLLSAPTDSQGTRPERSLNLVGEIMDSRCAVDGSHDKMMKQNGTKTAKDCTLQCAKSGGSFVLYDPETKSVYQLDDQQKPQRFAGQKVRVSGIYDEPSKTMHVESIESAEMNTEFGSRRVGIPPRSWSMLQKRIVGPTVRRRLL